MSRLNALAIMSGDLVGARKSLKRLKELSNEFFLVSCIGAGTQINQEFIKNGWPIKFGLLGRICTTLEQRLACERISRDNMAIVQDIFAQEGIISRVIIPFDDIGDVSCPVNGDLKILQAYNGYDRLLRFTQENRVDKKRECLVRAARALKLGEEDPELSKLEVEGF